jgi:hypothetical protein
MKTTAPCINFQELQKTIAPFMGWTNVRLTGTGYKGYEIAVRGNQAAVEGLVEVPKYHEDLNAVNVVEQKVLMAGHGSTYLKILRETVYNDYIYNPKDSAQGWVECASALQRSQALYLFLIQKNNALFS